MLLIEEVLPGLQATAASRMRRLRGTLALSFYLCICLCALPGVAAAAPQDLLQVYALARAADPVLAQAEALRGAQQEATLQARAPMLPQWNVTAGATSASGGGGRSQAVTSSLSQVLWDLGRMREWDASQSLSSAQDANLRAAGQGLRARVAQAYFGILSAQAAYSTAQASEDVLARQVHDAEQRLASGLSASLDVEQSRAYYALGRSATLQAGLLLEDAREALAQITGETPGPLKRLARDLPSLPPQPAAPDAWVRQAVAANPALQALALALEATEQHIGAARAGHLPTVSLGLDSQRTGLGALGNSYLPGANVVGLRITLPLFAGGSVQSQVRQAMRQRDFAREQFEAARRALVRETRAQHQAVLVSAAQMQATQASVRAAERALAANQTGLALGARSMTDVLLALQTLTAAQNALEQARHGQVLARLLLQQAAGSLGDAELAAVNALLEEP
jgi:outer membrane protein